MISLNVQPGTTLELIESGWDSFASLDELGNASAANWDSKPTLFVFNGVTSDPTLAATATLALLNDANGQPTQVSISLPIPGNYAASYLTLQLQGTINGVFTVITLGTVYVGPVNANVLTIKGVDADTAIQTDALAAITEADFIDLIGNILDAFLPGNFNNLLITGDGSLITVTNLANAPTAGDFTTDMKASLNAAIGTISPSAIATAVWATLKTALTVPSSIGQFLLTLFNASNFTGAFPASVVANCPTATAACSIANTTPITPGQIQIYQYSSFVLPGTGAAITIAVVDQNGNPINLLGKTLELLATAPATPGTVLWKWNTVAPNQGGLLTITGAAHNVITITADNSQSHNAGNVNLFVWDVTGGITEAVPEAAAVLTILPVPQPVA